MNFFFKSRVNFMCAFKIIRDPLFDLLTLCRLPLSRSMKNTNLKIANCFSYYGSNSHHGLSQQSSLILFRSNHWKILFPLSFMSLKFDFFCFNNDE